jgi:hypothetical protein
MTANRMRYEDLVRCEDLAYTRQFFAITRIGHSSPAAEFSTPAMVWEVSCWPRRHKDPHEFNMRDDSAPSGLKSDRKIRDEHGKLVRDMTDGLNDLLRRLQLRGCVTGSDPAPAFSVEQPPDWEPGPPGGPPSMDPDSDAVAGDDRCFDGFTTGACGFTLWWPDAPRGEINLLGDSLTRRPLPTDLRVRVQAETSEDFSSITFFLDAGKPWDQDPADCTETARERGLAGRRRGDIFRHVENIRTICENRLRPQGTRQQDATHAQSDATPALVELPPLPERICAVPPAPPPDIAGKREEECATEAQRELLKRWKAEEKAWLEREEAAAAELKAAADYLYKTVWDEFCKDFGFNLCDIASRTSEVFANFRGLVMSTSGIADPDKKPATGAGAAATRLLPRFNAGHDGDNADPVEPKAIVKAFQPFMRRFRPDADWRDWIACGIFDRRAIYISPLGSHSAYRPWDEGDFDRAIPAGHLPDRLTRNGVAPEALAACAEFIRDPAGHLRSAPETHRDDRPEPLRYLVLTRHAPNRRQIGRMIERINMTGVRRLYALKNWTVLQQTSTWVRIYGQQLDEAYLQWVIKTNAARDAYRNHCNSRWNDDIARLVGTLTNPKACDEAGKALGLRDAFNQERAIAALLKLYDKYSKERSIARRLLFCRPRDWKQWEEIQGLLDELRQRKEDRDIKLTEHNQTAEQALIRIATALDRLGQAAVGGLSYRINRSRDFAERYRRQAAALNDSSIETWWSYSQFATRGMEPTLRFIESIGERHLQLHERLQGVKRDILQSSIDNQTASARDNTYRLERIEAAVGRGAAATERSAGQLCQANYLNYLLLLFLIAAAGFLLRATVFFNRSP